MYNRKKNKEMAKCVVHVGKDKGLSAGNAMENERRGWDEESYRRKNENPINNYDWSRHRLNFEIVGGKVVPLGSQKDSLYERYQKVLTELGYKEYKAGATNKQNSYVEIIASGDTALMQWMAFGDQEVNYERNPEEWKNWDVRRYGRIEYWAVDTYNFFCQRYGKENIIGFEVHLDETAPHAHVNIVPTALMKQRGNVGGYVKVDGEGKPLTYKKGKHVGEVIKLSKSKYEALSEEKKKEYRPAERGTVRTISYASHFGDTKAERSQKMSELHDEYYYQVGMIYGLERGDVWADLPPEERAKRRHKTKEEAFREKEARKATEEALMRKDVAEREAVEKETKGKQLDKENSQKKARGESLDRINNWRIAEAKRLDEDNEKKQKVGTQLDKDNSEKREEGKQLDVALREKKSEFTELSGRYDRLLENYRQLSSEVTGRKKQDLPTQNAALRQLVDDVAPGLREVGEELTDPNLLNDDLGEEHKKLISSKLSSVPTQRLKEAVAALHYGYTFVSEQARHTKQQVITAAAERPLQELKEQDIDFLEMAAGESSYVATRVATVALCLFLGNGEAAAMASGGGGGGSSPLAGWDGRRKDESDWDFAGRCFLQACRACGICAGAARQPVRHRRNWG